MFADNETITPEAVYLKRREFLTAGGFIGASLLLRQAEAAYTVNDPDRPLTKEEYATGYNNYYEFSLEKKEVRGIAERWKRPEPWTIKIEGLVEKPFTLDLSAFLKKTALEERIYRFRCVEAWSMVLPWQGFPLAQLITEAKPKATAKYVRFVTYVDRKAMPNVSGMPHYPWPYAEGLTLEEATHPLAFLATGLYGKPLKNQNGAPIRLVVPWKYGFKSIKSIATIEFVTERPKTLWQQLAPSEYGFYANVNPDVPHPRWTQAKETRIDGSFFPTKLKTLRFNGYEDQVASLYKGLDLKANY